MMARKSELTGLDPTAVAEKKVAGQQGVSSNPSKAASNKREWIIGMVSFATHGEFAGQTASLGR